MSSALALEAPVVGSPDVTVRPEPAPDVPAVTALPRDGYDKKRVSARGPTTDGAFGAIKAQLVQGFWLTPCVPVADCKTQAAVSFEQDGTMGLIYAVRHPTKDKAVRVGARGRYRIDLAAHKIGLKCDGVRKPESSTWWFSKTLRGITQWLEHDRPQTRLTSFAFSFDDETLRIKGLAPDQTRAAAAGCHSPATGSRLASIQQQLALGVWSTPWGPVPTGTGGARFEFSPDGAAKATYTVKHPSKDKWVRVRGMGWYQIDQAAEQIAITCEWQHDPSDPDSKTLRAIQTWLRQELPPSKPKSYGYSLADGALCITGLTNGL